MAYPVQRKRKVKKRHTSFFGKWGVLFFLAVLFFLGGGAYKFRDGFLYYLGFKTDKYASEPTAEQRKIADIRIYEVLHKQEDKAFGFDVSEYQSSIDWEQTYHIDEAFELSFVFIRATAGQKKVDRRFAENWKAAQERQLIRGAYHYYRPNENSIAQAAHFIKQVRLQKGDLPPVLDIEKLPKNQSIAQLKIGLRRWLEKVEAHYKVKPIIYSGERYYTDFLKKEFANYPLWIANYNFWRKDLESDWEFWQFTEKGTIAGINGAVDLNVFKGTTEQLKRKTIQ